MTEKLMEAIFQGELWMKHFNRSDYAASFARYCEKYAPLYAAALEDTTPEKLAQELLEGVAQHWKKAHFWQRGVYRTNDKLMVVFYLTPMLLHCGESELAQILCRAWNAKWPDDAYEMADYDTVEHGFRNTVMGFAIGDRKG